MYAPPLVIFPIFVVGALGWGVYARLARSTAPAMVVHGVVDVVSFAWFYTHPDALPDLLATSAIDNGMDPVTWLALVGTVVATAALVGSFVRMARVRGRPAS